MHYHLTFIQHTNMKLSYFGFKSCEITNIILKTWNLWSICCQRHMIPGVQNNNLTKSRIKHFDPSPYKIIRLIIIYCAHLHSFQQLRQRNQVDYVSVKLMPAFVCSVTICILRNASPKQLKICVLYWLGLSS